MEKMALHMETEKKVNGWQVSVRVLEEVSRRIGDNDESPSLEQIEMVLLAFHGFPQNETEEIEEVYANDVE